MQEAMVVGRSTDHDGNLVGTYNRDPIFYTRVYDLMFPDSAIQDFS